MKRTIATAVTAATLLLLSATVASADPPGLSADPLGSARLEFWGGFGAAAHCDGSGIIPSPMTVPAPGFGFAVVQAPASGNLGATIAIRDIPNGYYTVRLIQGLSDCGTIDWAGFANAAGNVTIHLSEPAASTTAFVAVDQWATFGGVPVSVNVSYVTPTYIHA